MKIISKSWIFLCGIFAVAAVFPRYVHPSGGPSQMIRVDLTKTPLQIDQSIPFGKSVLLYIKTAGRADLVTVSYIVGSKIIKKEAVKTENLWQIIVGPFPPGGDTQFLFETTAILSEQERNELAGKIEKALRVLPDKITASLPLSPQNFKSVLEKTFRESLEANFDAYKTAEGKSLPDIFLAQVFTLDLKIILEQINTTSGKKDIVANLTDEFLFLTDKKLLEADVLDKLDQTNKGILETIKKDVNAIDGTEKCLEALSAFVLAAQEKAKTLSDKKMQENIENTLTAVSEEVESLGNINETIKNFRKKLEDIIKNLADKVKKEQIVLSEPFSVTAEVSNVESYAGFDVSELFVLGGQKAMGTFFLINPYFKKIEVDEETGTFPDIRSLSLSFGICLRSADLETIDGGIFYAGLAYRLNKVFRVSAGWVIYKDPLTATADSAAVYKAHFALGIGINFRDFGDLLKIFKGSSAYINE